MINEQPATEPAKFSNEQLDLLRKESAELETVNPTGPAFTSLRNRINTLPLHLLEQLSGANIKWMSQLADEAIMTKLLSEVEEALNELDQNQ